VCVTLTHGLKARRLLTLYRSRSSERLQRGCGSVKTVVGVENR
jgi:hypothetical protein